MASGYGRPFVQLFRLSRFSITLFAIFRNASYIKKSFSYSVKDDEDDDDDDVDGDDADDHDDNDDGSDAAASVADDDNNNNNNSNNIIIIITIIIIIIIIIIINTWTTTTILTNIISFLWTFLAFLLKYTHIIETTAVCILNITYVWKKIQQQQQQQQQQ